MGRRVVSREKEDSMDLLVGILTGMSIVAEDMMPRFGISCCK